MGNFVIAEAVSAQRTYFLNDNLFDFVEMKPSLNQLHAIGHLPFLVFFVA